jgi:hypothetical protein
MTEARGPGVLDRPIESGDDSFLWSGAVHNIFSRRPGLRAGTHSHRC